MWRIPTVQNPTILLVREGLYALLSNSLDGALSLVLSEALAFEELTADVDSGM